MIILPNKTQKTHPHENTTQRRHKTQNKPYPRDTSITKTPVISHRISYNTIYENALAKTLFILRHTLTKNIDTDSPPRKYTLTKTQPIKDKHTKSLEKHSLYKGATQKHVVYIHTSE